MASSGGPVVLKGARCGEPWDPGAHPEGPADPSSGQERALARRLDTTLAQGSRDTYTHAALHAGETGKGPALCWTPSGHPPRVPAPRTLRAHRAPRPQRPTSVGAQLRKGGTELGAGPSPSKNPVLEAAGACPSPSHAGGDPGPLRAPGGLRNSSPDLLPAPSPSTPAPAPVWGPSGATALGVQVEATGWAL